MSFCTLENSAVQKLLLFLFLWTKAKNEVTMKAISVLLEGRRN